MTSLVGPLLVDMNIFEDVIRSENYAVERCIERYFELIEIYGEYRVENNSGTKCDFMTEDSNNVFNPTGTTTWFPKESNATCVVQKVNQIICEEDLNSTLSTEHISRQNTECSANFSDVPDSKELCPSLNVDNCTEGLDKSENNSVVQCGMMAKEKLGTESPSIPATETRERRTSEAASLDFEEEKEQIDNAINLQNQLVVDAASNQVILETFPDGQQKNSEGKFIKIESVKLAKGDMQIFFGFFDGLIEEPELMSYWNKSYSDRLSDVCRGIAMAIDISLVMSGAISMAISHLEDQENDWDETLQESDVIYDNDNVHGVADDGEVFTIPSDYEEIDANEREKCSNRIYSSHYDTSSEGSENRKQAEHLSATEVLFETVRNVLGNQKCKYSDKFIYHALKICNNDLNRSVEFILMSQTSQALSYDPSRSILSKYAHKKYDKLSNSTFSYADILAPKAVGDHDFPISLRDGNYIHEKMDTSLYEDLNLHYKEKFKFYDDRYLNDVADLHSVNAPEVINSDQMMGSRITVKDGKQKPGNVWSSSHISRSDHDRENREKNQKNKVNENDNDDENDFQFDSENIYYDIYGNIIFDDRETNNNYKKNNNKSNSDGEYKIQESRSTIKNNKNPKSNKGKSLQWRLVASKEGAKMKESLLKQTLQRNLPPAFAENRKIYRTFLYSLISSFLPFFSSLFPLFPVFCRPVS